MSEELKFIVHRRRLKTHQKSKQGCLRCRSKRIKCNEAKPACTACLRNSAQCVYPPPKPATATTLQIPTPPPNPWSFHLQDLRLFHDFMTASWPHLPLERDDAWRYEVPIVAQQHEFLMHGILSLGAAHLHAVTDQDLKQSVERHRMLAVRGLNGVSQALESSAKLSDTAIASQMTAALAAAYVLTFTASYMGDSLNLFLVLVRACSSITRQIIQAGVPSPLVPWTERSPTSAVHLELMQRRLHNATALPIDEVDSCLASLQRLELECDLLPFQKAMLNRMKAILIFAEQPSEAYRHFIDLYSSFSDMPDEDFTAFTDESNVASVVLQAHFLAIEAMLGPWLQSELTARLLQGGRNGIRTLPEAVGEGAGKKAGELCGWAVSYLDKIRAAG